MTPYLQRLLARVAPPPAAGLAPATASAAPGAKLASPLAESDQRLHLPAFSGLVGLDLPAESPSAGMTESAFPPQPEASPPHTTGGTGAPWSSPIAGDSPESRAAPNPLQPRARPPDGAPWPSPIAPIGGDSPESPADPNLPRPASALADPLEPDPAPISMPPSGPTPTRPERRVAAAGDPFDIPPDALEPLRAARGDLVPARPPGEDRPPPPETAQHAAPAPAGLEARDTVVRVERPAPAPMVVSDPSPPRVVPTAAPQAAIPAPLAGPKLRSVPADPETPQEALPASPRAGHPADGPGPTRPELRAVPDQRSSGDPLPRQEPPAATQPRPPAQAPMTAAAASMIGPLPVRRTTAMLFGMRRP